MARLSCIWRGNSNRRTSSYSNVPNSRQASDFSANIAAGKTTPSTTFIDVPPTNIPGHPSQAREDIPMLHKFWRHLFQRTKPRGQIAEADHTKNPITAGLQDPVKRIEDPLRSLQQQKTNHSTSANALPLEPKSLSGQDLAAPEPNRLCSTGNENKDVSIGGTVLVVEGRQPRATAESSNNRGTVHGTERRSETTEASEPKASESSTQSRRDYKPNSTLSDPYAEAWIGASLLKLPSGEFVSSKLFYDPGSSDNMITEALVARHGFRKHLIRPEDLKVYECAGEHFFTPTYYVEIELMDHEHGIVELSKASFNVADNLGGWALLVGRKFMFENNLGMGPRTNPSTVLVLTARPASEDAKKEQARLVEKNKHNQYLAAQIMTGSSRSATSSSSRRPSSSRQVPTLSSRTSASSSTHVEGRNKL